MITLHATVRGRHLAFRVDPHAPLGWRFWTFAGFPTDPIEPRPYGGSRGIPLHYDATVRGWLVAMEADDSLQVFTPHELFPCPDQSGADEFALRFIAGLAAQPDLFPLAPDSAPV